MYNFGIFRLHCEDYVGAIFAFNRYNEKTCTNRAGELIGLCNLLSENFTESLKIIKKNMLKDPTNMKYRWWNQTRNYKESSWYHAGSKPRKKIKFSWSFWRVPERSKKMERI